MAAHAADPTIRRQVMSAARGQHHPILELEAFTGRASCHPLTRAERWRFIGLPMEPESAVDQLVAASLAGLSA